MINPFHFRRYIIEPVLHRIGLHSEAAVELLLGTAYIESGLTFLKQTGGGPALGLYQIEPKTHADVFTNFLRYRVGLRDRVIREATERLSNRPEHDCLIGNLFYATAVARIIYFRRPEALPAAGDLDAQAQYYKRCYNTPLGKGTVERYIRKVSKLGIHRT